MLSDRHYSVEPTLTMNLHLTQLYLSICLLYKCHVTRIVILNIPFLTVFVELYRLDLDGRIALMCFLLGLAS